MPRKTIPNRSVLASLMIAVSMSMMSCVASPAIETNAAPGQPRSEEPVELGYKIIEGCVGFKQTSGETELGSIRNFRIFSGSLVAGEYYHYNEVAGAGLMLHSSILSSETTCGKRVEFPGQAIVRVIALPELETPSHLDQVGRSIFSAALSRCKDAVRTGNEAYLNETYVAAPTIIQGFRNSGKFIGCEAVVKNSGARAKVETTTATYIYSVLDGKAWVRGGTAK